MYCHVTVVLSIVLFSYYINKHLLTVLRYIAYATKD